MSKDSPRRAGLPQAPGPLTRPRADRRLAVLTVVPLEGSGGATLPALPCTSRRAGWGDALINRKEVELTWN